MLTHCGLVTPYSGIWHQATIRTNGDFTGNAKDIYLWYEFANYWFNITNASYRGQCFQYKVITWKHFSRYWPFVREFTGHRWSPRTKPVARSFNVLICAWKNGWVNNCKAGDLRRRRVHYDVTVMLIYVPAVSGARLNNGLLPLVIKSKWGMILYKISI